MVYVKCLARSLWRFVQLSKYERRVFLKDFFEFLGLVV
jgi:hypothetical protein